MEQATISNPNTSEAAKEHSRQIVQELEGQGTDTYPPRQTHIDDEVEEVTIEPDRSNVLGDNARPEGVLDDTGPVVDDGSFAGKDPNRVLGGFKAALHSECSLLETHDWWTPTSDIPMRRSHLTDPNTSKEAKDHAKAKLEQHGVTLE